MSITRLFFPKSTNGVSIAALIFFVILHNFSTLLAFFIAESMHSWYNAARYKSSLKQFPGGACMGEKDLAEKTLESCNDVFADIINVLFFGGRRKIKEQELEQAVMGSVCKADRKLRGQERDTAKYWRSHSIRISLLGIENETDADSGMPLRIFGYDGAS